MEDALPFGKEFVVHSELEIIRNIDLVSLLDSSISILSAFVFGTIIGIERQYRQRNAGLRTNALVAVGAAIFVDMANRLDGHSGAVRVVSYVVSGIGFLGAGVIMREQGGVRGLNTAATLWGSAAVGACCGGDLILEALVGTTFVLMANTLLRPVAEWVNRTPLDGTAIESATTVYAVANKLKQKQALSLLKAELSSGNYPAKKFRMRPFGTDDIQIEALLAAMHVNDKELDEITTRLSEGGIISKAYWSPSILE